MLIKNDWFSQLKRDKILFHVKTYLFYSQNKPPFAKLSINNTLTNN